MKRVVIGALANIDVAKQQSSNPKSDPSPNPNPNPNPNSNPSPNPNPNQVANDLDNARVWFDHVRLPKSPNRSPGPN